MTEASDDYPTPTHRVSLEFWWDRERSPLIVIGMNPSQASRKRGDATVIRCARRAGLLGHGGLVMLNAHPFHATAPRDLWRAPVLPEAEALNLEAIASAFATWPDAPVLFAPGGDRHPRHRARIDEIVRIAERAGVVLLCLGTTRDGTPRHPLYCPYETPLVVWERPLRGG